MKDAYSFHMNAEDLHREYLNMRDAYVRIFTRLGANFRAVKADSGNIGGALSEEFHILAGRSEEHTSELPSLMRISYSVFCLKKKAINEHMKCVSKMSKQYDQIIRHNV